MDEAPGTKRWVGWWIVAVVVLMTSALLAVGMATYREFFDTGQSGSFLLVYVPTPFGQIVFQRDGVSFDRPPEYYANGFEQLRREIQWLSHASSKIRAVGVYPDQRSQGFILESQNGELIAMFLFNRAIESATEENVRAIFAERGILPEFDDVDTGATPAGGVDLRYPLEEEIDDITEILQRVLTDAYSVNPAGGLYFDR